MQKRVTILLNVSLALAACYYVLYFIGYFAQKQLIWGFFYDKYFIDEFEPVFSPVIIVFSVVVAAGITVFNLLLRKKGSPLLYVGAEVFAVIAFMLNMFVKNIACSVITLGLQTCDGADGVVLGSMHSRSVSCLDAAFVTIFVVSLALMVCVCCLKQCESKMLTQ